MTKILLVEDDNCLAEAFRLALSQHHYVVDVSHDGQEAWEMTEFSHYDLIVLDWILPSLDGINFCKQLRMKGIQTPVLLLTARNDGDSRIVGLDAGVDDYVTKPISFQELHARIRALLRRSRLALASTLKWGNLEINPNLCQVTYNGKVVPLRNKEYNLLELLLRNNQHIFSQQALLNALWSLDDHPTANTVRAHIKSIRKQLKKAGAGDVIETLYGMGYRLRSEELTVAPIAAAPIDPELPLPVIPPEFATNWERYRDRYSERLQVIEQALSAFQSGIGNKALTEQAQREAHTLIGSLGSFGLDEAAQLAREIEQVLAGFKGSLLAAKKLDFLAERVDRMRQILDHSQVEIPSPTPAIESLVSPPHPTRLLIIDDDRDLAEQLAIAANFTGLTATVAVNLIQARAAIADASSLPDIILLDLELTDETEDGFLLLQQLRQQHPQIPVIVLTAHQELADRVKVARLGGRGYLQKPILPFQVMAIVSQVLQQSAATEASLMIVDDDPQILEILDHTLRPLGFNLTLLSDPQNFWETLESTEPELLILNIEMPNWNGVELCQVIRNDLRWNKLPVVFLSAHTDAATIQQVFAAGADDYLSKPVPPTELVSRVLNRLNRVKHQGVSAFQFQFS
jgi:DNA-binding response OmpR family regulator/HPt (histidine-containing phosphotransfer) domain-containing protein